jgi:hypothetical protein
MIRTHLNKQRGLQSLVAEVKCDAIREIRNGAPFVPYLPKDLGRRARLLDLLRQAQANKENS